MTVINNLVDVENDSFKYLSNIEGVSDIQLEKIPDHGKAIHMDEAISKTSEC